MAVPSTSARSQAAMATSARIHRNQEIRRSNMARHAWARSVPVTMPSRAERRLEQDRHDVRHHQHPEQAIAEPEPPAMSVAQLPGSM